MKRRSFLKMLGLAPVATGLVVDTAIPDEVSAPVTHGSRADAPGIRAWLLSNDDEVRVYTSDFGTAHSVPGHIQRAHTKALLDDVMMKTYGP